MDNMNVNKEEKLISERISNSSSNKNNHNQSIQRKTSSSKSFQQFQDEDEIDSSNSNKKSEKSKSSWLQILPRILIVLTILTIITLTIIYHKQVLDGYKDFIEWLSDHEIQGFFILIFAYIAATVCFFPGSLLTLGAGYCFNQALGNQGLAIVMGVGAVFIGAMTGSVCSFLIARYVLRDLVERKALKWVYFKAVDKVTENQGFRVVLLFRLAPLTPFNIFNYLMGITAVKLKEYFLAGFGMIPATIIFVYFGTSISQIADLIKGEYDGGILYIVFMILGGVIAFVALIYIGYLAKKEFNQILQNNTEERIDSQDEQNNLDLRNSQEEESKKLSFLSKENENISKNKSQ